MNNPALQRVKEVFAHATGLSSQERVSYLDAACAGDPSLRAEVTAYLEAAERTDAFLGKSVDQAKRSWPRRRARGWGDTSCCRRSAKGPVRRKLVMKAIKVGMDTAEVIARFEAERQALAMMVHPHVAKVLDAGATETGRPYFVMELVNGLPTTDYCDAKNLNFDARLEQFVQVCQAVQHAPEGAHPP